MDVILTPALLGRKVDYGEFDRICTLLTRQQGKISALAKAARRSRKRYGGSLSLFVIGQASLRAARRGELWSLERFDCSEDLSAGIASDVVKLAHGSYMIELARELWPVSQPEPASFDLLCEALRTLSRRPASPALLRAFELQALGAAGVGPVLDRCLYCGRQPADEAVTFSAQRGGILCAGCVELATAGEAGAERSRRLPLSAEARRLLWALQSMAPAAAADCALPAAAARMMREAMILAVRQTLSTEIRSLAFIAQLAGSGRPAEDR